MNLETNIVIELIEPVNLYSKYQITSKTKVKPIEPLLFIDESLVLTKGNISVVGGAAKSRKTYFVCAIINAMYTGNWEAIMTGGCKKIAVFDTEQYDADVKRIYERINKMNKCNDSIDIFSLRGRECDEMYEVIDNYIMSTDTEFIVIDGIADLMKDPNSIEESTKIRNWLMNRTQERNIHILCCLHVNYDSPKLRGHLGSELERKCEHSFLLTKEGEKTVVKGKLCRRKEYRDFSFFIHDDAPVSDSEMPFKIKELKPIENFIPSYYEKENDGMPF